MAYRPDIGYFDGLNFVAAMVLQFQDAESAFTSTVNLFSEYIVDAVDPERKPNKLKPPAKPRNTRRKVTA